MSLLDSIDFGLGAAHLEQNLREYFYRSGSFKQACSDKTYLVVFQNSADPNDRMGEAATMAP